MFTLLYYVANDLVNLEKCLQDNDNLNYSCIKNQLFLIDCDYVNDDNYFNLVNDLTDLQDNLIIYLSTFLSNHSIDCIKSNESFKDYDREKDNDAHYYYYKRYYTLNDYLYNLSFSDSVYTYKRIYTAVVDFENICFDIDKFIDKYNDIFNEYFFNDFYVKYQQDIYYVNQVLDNLYYENEECLC